MDRARRRSQPDRSPIARQVGASAISLRPGAGTVTAGCCDPIKEEATMRVEESIFIDRPPEAVFGFLLVRSNDPVWMASATESEWLDPAAPMGVGRRGRMVMDAMGRREFLDEVTEYEPGRRIAHRSVAGPRAIRTACIAEPAGNGCCATVVYQPERLPGGVMGRLTAPLTARIVRRNFRADLARLKHILEAESEVAR
jgi:uncharacterized membrane protein